MSFWLFALYIHALATGNTAMLTCPWCVFFVWPAVIKSILVQMLVLALLFGSELEYNNALSLQK